MAINFVGLHSRFSNTRYSFCFFLPRKAPGLPCMCDLYFCSFVPQTPAKIPDEFSLLRPCVKPSSSCFLPSFLSTRLILPLCSLPPLPLSFLFLFLGDLRVACSSHKILTHFIDKQAGKRREKNQNDMRNISNSDEMMKEKIRISTTAIKAMSGIIKTHDRAWPFPSRVISFLFPASGFFSGRREVAQIRLNSEQ